MREARGRQVLMGSNPRAQLGGWKAIAAYLQRDERTVMRWAAQRGMPVQRVPGQGRASVYASPEALDAWLRSGASVNAADPPIVSPPSTIEAGPAKASRHAPHRWPILAFCLALGLIVLLTVPRRDAKLHGATPVFTDPAAKALYLKATYDWNLRTSDSLWRATREYSAAIGRDPRVAEPFVGLANSYLLLREYGSLPDDQAYPRAEAAAKAALALAPSTAAMHRVLAFLAFWWHGDRTMARREFATALALAPNDALTHHWFATALSANGQHQAALREIDAARDLDPTSASIVADAGLLTYLAGQRRLGLSMLLAQARDQPQDVSARRALADIALFEGRPSDYIVQRAALAQFQGDEAAERTVGRLAAAARSAGAETLLTAMLADARAGSDGSTGGYYTLARVASLAGRAAEAEAALARACGGRETAAIGANGDLWLSRSLSSQQVRRLCGYATLLS